MTRILRLLLEDLRAKPALRVALGVTIAAELMLVAAAVTDSRILAQLALLCIPVIVFFVVLSGRRR